ncbi:hypothetical protein TWF506_005480 [Arthrobotrys conoides]|uniref:Uncharacterized protein n=1 Tax=Arthrobotrys conoides TaxID=74498 RepID=A0AAN8RW16_9PEZI
MEYLIDSSVHEAAMAGKKSTNPKPREKIRRSGAISKRDAAQLSSSSSNSLSTPNPSIQESKKNQGKQLTQTFPEDKNRLSRNILLSSPQSSPPVSSPLSPLLPPTMIPSRYVAAPADERDEIIEALASELETEQYFKTKARWELNDDYLEELDTIAPSILQEKFHDKITAISEKFFSRSIAWELLGSCLAPRIKNTTKMFFPEFIRLPCTPETWDAVQQHPDMTSALFIEGILSNSLAYQMCDSPVYQAEGSLAIVLGMFHNHCKRVSPGGPQGAEWMALTLQMIDTMLHSNETDPRRQTFPDIKSVEKSSQARKLIWALIDALRILREAVKMPFDQKEWNALEEMTQDLVYDAFRLSIQWHSRPLAFGHHGMTWFSQNTLQSCSDTLGCELDNEDAIWNWEEGHKYQKKKVIAVISPMFFREEWKCLQNTRSRLKVWKEPKLFVAPISRQWGVK